MAEVAAVPAAATTAAGAAARALFVTTPAPAAVVAAGLRSLSLEQPALKMKRELDLPATAKLLFLGRILALTFCVGFALETQALAQPAPASPAQLAAITERGKALAAYDQAAWHGTDAAQAVASGDTSGLQYYIARKTPTGWAVDFGKLDPSGTTFLTAIEAVSSDGFHFTAQRLTPARADTGFLVAGGHAIATSEAVFKPIAHHKYNVAVIPNSDGTMYVYLYPAQTNVNIFPVGGDERFTISADGTKILDAHRMHNSILEQPDGLEQTISTGNPGGPQISGPQLVAGFRTVVVENVPQDTDVFFVLLRRPPAPDYIDAQGQLYLINTDGTITYKGPAAAKP
jgi:hypothetical protein